MNEILLGNRYLLGKRVGIGGMAYVYEAEDTLLKRKVAVKILKQQFVDDEDFIRKFELEAQSAASLNHPNIVNVYDVGRDVVDDKPLHYIVMELVQGTTLKDVIQAQGKLSNPAIARISLQIANGLECAHEMGTVHRDIKPANILIMKSGDVKVADFGIARLSTTATITYTTSILGTVHYISPEQAKGKYVDQKSDIYSLGIVMYEMATGVVPFDAENSVGIAVKHIQEAPVPPIERNPNLDPGLNAIILKALEKEPNDRFESTTVMIEALKQYKTYAAKSTLEDRETMKTTRMVVPKETSKKAVYQTRTETPEEEDSEPKKSKFKWILLAGVLAVAVVIGLVFVIGTNHRRAQEEASTVVPLVEGSARSLALESLKQAELEGVVVSEVADDEVDADVVIYQSILPNTVVEKGTVVNLTVSTGKAAVTVPNVVGTTLESAESQLETLGFKIERVNYEASDAVEPGEVIRTEPEANASIAYGSAITLVVSKGELVTTTVVPVLTGLTQRDALDALAAQNLKPGEITPEYSDIYEANIVTYQSIPSSEVVEENTAIDLRISLGKEPVSSEESSSEASSSAASSASTVTPPPESSAPASSEETQPEEPIDQGLPDKVNYTFQLRIPAGDAKTFHVQIYDLSVDPEKPVYDRVLDKSTANASGIIELTLEGTTESSFRIYYDGKETETNGVTPN